MKFRFIAGTDEFLVQRRARDEWEDMAASVSDPHAVEIIDAQAGTVDEVARTVNEFISAIRTISLFAPEKAVWLKGVSFLADTVTGRANGTQEEIEHLQNALQEIDPAAVKVLISASPVDRRKKAYKWFHANGDGIFIEAGKDAQAVLDMIREEASISGARFTANAAQILVELTGGNARLALEETRKLTTYLGPEGGDITPALVGELVPSIGESDFFEAAEAFFSLDLQWSLAAVHRHFFAGHDARPLISSLQNRNRLLIQIKALQMGGAIRGGISKSGLEQVGHAYGSYFGDAPAKSSFCLLTQNPWYLGRLSENLSRTSLKALIEFQEAFRDAFMEIISRPNEQEAVIRAMVIRCLSPLQSRSA